MLQITTKAQFDDIVEQIKINVSLYENYLRETQYKLFLANKKVIDIGYEKDSIPHILGINLDVLRASNLYKEKSSYELMKAFLADSYRMYSKLDDLTKPFSEYVIQKNEIFRENLKIVLTDVECVIDYRKDRIYGLEVIECPCEYYILQRKGHNLLLLGLVKRGNIYVPQTSQKLDLSEPKDQENLKNILFHQNITFVNSLRYTNNYDSDTKVFYVDPQSKSDKLLSLNRYANKYESTIAIDGDYSFILKKLNEIYMNENKMKSTLQIISTMINNGEVVDMDLLDEDTDCDIKDVVKAYNNSRFVETDNGKYSELLEKYNELKTIVEQLQKENEKLEQIKTSQSEKIEELQRENDEHKDAEQKILTILQNKK